MTTAATIHSAKSIVFDIETGPLPVEEIGQIMPEFEAPKNLKDPEKIKEAIAAKRKAWFEDAALNPITGRVIAIGLLIDNTFVLISDPATESQILYEFWDCIQGNGSIHRIVGFYCNTFDLPFLIKRSWKLGVSIPPALREGRYFSRQVVDVCDEWKLGDRQAQGSLDVIAKFLGIGEKTGNGADFASLWSTNREAAIEYLKNDVRLIAGVAKKLGLL